MSDSYLNGAPVGLTGGGGGGIAFAAGHIWERLSPSSTGGGAVFFDSDTGVFYDSSGDDATGWWVRLVSASRQERCGLQMGVGSIFRTQDLSAFTIDAVTLAVAFHWDGDTGGDYYGFAALGQRIGVGGIPALGLKANGAGFDLSIYRGGSTFEVLKNYAAKADFAVGVHAVAIAAVTVLGVDTWRFSIDGDPVAEVPIAGGYFAPSATSSVALGCTDAPDSPLHGAAYELAAWGSTLSNASLVALATPPTTTRALALSAATGAPTIWVRAQHYDTAFPTYLRARGVPAGMSVSIAGRVDY
jgi:hypothetical protein